MLVQELARQLRLLLDGAPDAQPLGQVLLRVDSFVQQCSSSPEADPLLDALHQEFQDIHKNVFDHTSIYHTEVFLSVLHHLLPLLSASSIISTWFDLVLRPALREPKLSDTAVDYAKDLIIAGLQKTSDEFAEKIAGFRNQLMQLYLLDALNEGSGEDVLEWASLDEEQRERRSRWKSNLEDVLVKYGLENPDDLFTAINDSFASPSHRLQLLMLLNRYTSQPSFSSHATVLASHPLISSLFLSLLLDNSSTVCTSGLTVLSKLLPIFAVNASEELKRLLPRLLLVLARIICWKERNPPLKAREALSTTDDNEESNSDEGLESVTDSDGIQPRPDLQWERLEATFSAAASSAPLPHQYFTYLYYMFPCNAINFLRGPVAYMNKYYGSDSPYVEPWHEVLDQDEIKSKSESMLRGHVLHPLLLWGDAAEELQKPRVWAEYDVSRIVGECTMLDVRHAALGLQARQSDAEAKSPADNTTPRATEEEETPKVPVIDLTSDPAKPRVSMCDMIAISSALKSSRDIVIVDTEPGWPPELFCHSAIVTPTASAEGEPSKPESNDLPTHVAQAISGLQREILLLRNELNFELWMNRENVKQIGRLYQDRILSRNAEMERQGLHNKLREYKKEVIRLQRDLKDKSQTSSARQKYAKWNQELESKIREFREQKKQWTAEATVLRNELKEAKETSEAQRKLLSDADHRVFALETSIKENQHKIDRLHDYEHRIEQLTQTQRLWEKDIQRCKDQAAIIQSLVGKYKKMKMRTESSEKAQEESENELREERKQTLALQAQLERVKEGGAALKACTTEITRLSSERDALIEKNTSLRDQNAEIKEEVEEMKAMVEILRAEVSGARGLVSEPSTSPILPSASPIIG